MNKLAAAFGWLCVETVGLIFLQSQARQPPSGGCVLKLLRYYRLLHQYVQPPSGGCVLKLDACCGGRMFYLQPPSVAIR